MTPPSTHTSNPSSLFFIILSLARVCVSVCAFRGVCHRAPPRFTLRALSSR